MKIWSLAILAALTVNGCSTSESSDSGVMNAPGQNKPEEKTWMSLKGQVAKDLYKAMTVSAIKGEKIVRGNGSISCDLQSGNIPPGAQGIIAPMANCVGFPHVVFPAGAQGLVAPWFNISGFSGYQFYSQMPVQAETDGSKSIRADFEIKCKRSSATCSIKKGGDTPVPAKAWISLGGSTAKNLYNAMSVSPIASEKHVEGKANLYCKSKISSIPAGAQGIAAPSADCVAYPIVQFPAGAQGLVAPWFNLNGFDGYVLFDKMTGIQVVDRAKSYKGKLSVVCTKGVDFKCEINK